MPVLITPPDMPEAVVIAIETMGNRARTELLRALSLSGTALTTTELAALVSMNRVWTLKHLQAMEEHGIVTGDIPVGERHGRLVKWSVEKKRLEELAVTWLEYASGQD